MLCQVVSSFAAFVDEIFKFCHTFLMYCLSKLRLSSVDLQTFTANYFSGCQSTGGHYNPLNKTHGVPSDQIR